MATRIDRVKDLLMTDKRFAGRGFAENPKLLNLVAKILEKCREGRGFLGYYNEFSRLFGPPGFDKCIVDHVNKYNKKHPTMEIDVDKVRFEAYKKAFENCTFVRMSLGFGDNSLKKLQSSANVVESGYWTEVDDILQSALTQAITQPDIENEYGPEDQRNGDLSDIDLSDVDIKQQTSFATVMTALFDGNILERICSNFTVTEEQQAGVVEDGSPGTDPNAGSSEPDPSSEVVEGDNPGTDPNAGSSEPPRLR